MVYGPYSPKSPGIVVAVFKVEHWRKEDRNEKKPLWEEIIANVKWLPKKKGPATLELFIEVDYLQSFQALINDHKKKLATHESKIKLLEDLLK